MGDDVLFNHNNQGRSTRVEQLVQRLAGEDKTIGDRSTTHTIVPYRLSRTAWIHSKLRDGWTIDQCIHERRQVLPVNFGVV